MKKRIFTISLLAICLSLCIGGTLAFFTAEDVATNVITAGSIKIQLNETGEGGKPFTEVSGVLPGEEVAKKVTVSNLSEANECWIRVKVDKSIELAQPSDEAADPEVLKIEFDTKNWEEKDGFYYYTKPVAPGEDTEALFETVKFDENMGNMYQNCKAYINVSAMAVQVKNNGKKATEANGWPDPATPAEGN